MVGETTINPWTRWARFATETIGSVVPFARTVYAVEHMKHLDGGIIIE